MRRLLYTVAAVAAVLALAPLAAITPASAAVQHPAAATVCDGNEEATIENHPSAGASNDSYWYSSPSGGVHDAHASITDWCVLPEGKVNNNYAFVLRQEGTSNCAFAADSTVEMTGCGSLATYTEEFQITHPSPQTGQMWAASAEDGFYVQGNGGDTPLELEGSSGLPNQIWTINCIANACTL
jgi:putative hemolysin